MKTIVFALLFLPFFVLAQVNSPGLAPQKKAALKLIKGTASYYHNKYNGRKTTSGEIFSNDSLTAAHKNLPLGTLVRVTNNKNDSVVVVKINDRLPQWSKRTIDLSVKAASQLNFLRAGLAKVKIEILSYPEAKQKHRKA